jgi:putative MATE family efflux protein
MHAPLSPNPLITAPILSTLIRLASPNMTAMAATALVAIAETAYVGLLGTGALAGLALVFPFAMLQQMMSAGAMGGGISSAVSRAIGAGDSPRAEALALHAAMIGVAGALAFMAIFLLFGRDIFVLLGGRGVALDEALAYSNVVFLGAPAIWLANTLASIVRGSGNMRVPSAALLTVATLQIALGGSLCLGLGPFPRLGMAGVALGQVVAYLAGALFLLGFLRSPRARVALVWRGRFDRRIFSDILTVGALACVSPLQTVLTVLILTRIIAQFGTEALAGYGIGVRLEFLVTPITFAIGVACVPMVGMAIGAGNVARARRVAWTGGALAAAIVGTSGLTVAAFPDVWATLFTRDPSVLGAARQYLTVSGPGFAFLGLGICLYFASQGAGKVLGPVLAGTIRLIVVALGGWWLVASDAPQWELFALVALAMAAYGLATATAVYAVSWERPARAGSRPIARQTAACACR